MSKSFLRIFNVIIFFTGPLIISLPSPFASVFAEDFSRAPAPIEVIVKGKVFSSLKEYENSKVSKKVQVKPKDGGVPWAVKAVTDLPAKLIPVGKKSLKSVPKPPQKAPHFSGGIDDKGWKTLVLDKQSLGTSQRPAWEDLKPPALPLPSLMPEQEVAIQRILGISPSMNALVKDFEEGPAVPVGTGLIKVSTKDELAEQFRTMASGMEGPFLLIFSHDRVRLMGLKSDNPSEKKE